MKGVNAANGTEVVAHLFAVETILCELRFTAGQLHLCRKYHHRAAHPAKRAVAAAHRIKPILQRHPVRHRATVALCCYFILHRDLLCSETRQLSAYAKPWDLAASGTHLSTIQSESVTRLIWKEVLPCGPVQPVSLLVYGEK